MQHVYLGALSLGSGDDPSDDESCPGVMKVESRAGIR